MIKLKFKEKLLIKDTEPKKYSVELQNQIKTDYSKLEWVDDFEGGKYINK
jgi:hypothetical protein